MTEYCRTCGGYGCVACLGSGRTREKPPDVDLDVKITSAPRLGVSISINSAPPPQPYCIPEGICRRCFQTDFSNNLVNTYCFDAEWIVLGYDDYSGTKNPDVPEYTYDHEGNYERMRVPASPGFFWRKTNALGVWGIQIRYYKDTNT